MQAAAVTGKGDVYALLGGSDKNPIPSKRDLCGRVFQTVKRNTIFEEYSPSRKYRLNKDTASAGYFVIEANALEGVENSKADDWVMVGIFVPYDGAPERKAIAGAVREQFGEGSALLKAPRCGYCNSYTEHDENHSFHCPVCRRGI